MRVLLLALLLLPFAAFAEGVPAGFPPAAIWLSKTELRDGDSAVIYTVVYNSSTEAVAGNVVFLMGGEPLGTRSFNVASGETEIVSLPWTAKEGSRSFSARIEGSSALSSTASGTTTVSVSPPPPPPPGVVEAIETAGTVKETIDTATPVVASIASSTYATTEGIRESTVRALERLASSTTPKGEVLGAEDQITPEENAGASFDIGKTIQNIWSAILNVLLFIARSPIWFYLLVLFVVIVVLSFVRTALSDRRRD